jgi:hypothetical protein
VPLKEFVSGRAQPAVAHNYVCLSHMHERTRELSIAAAAGIIIIIVTL